MNLELYGYALGETLASRDEASLPEPEPPEEHFSDCPCSECSGDPFLSRLVLAVVPEAHGRPEHTKSYQNPSVYAGSKASSADLFTGTRPGSAQEKGRRRCSRPAPEPTGDILTPEQVAQRLQVGVRWVYEQTRNREGMRDPDPLPFRKMGKYLRFYWPEVREWLDRQSKRVKKGGVHCETTNRMHRARR